MLIVLKYNSGQAIPFLKILLWIPLGLKKLCYLLGSL